MARRELYRQVINTSICRNYEGIDSFQVRFDLAQAWLSRSFGKYWESNGWGI